MLSHNHAVSMGTGLSVTTLAFAQYVNQPTGALWEVNVYQFDGNYLSAIYAFDPMSR